MKKLIIILLVLFAAVTYGQKEKLTGEISFISSQNIYVKFADTEGIEQGDTLFIASKDVVVPALIVRFKSSTSIAASKIAEIEMFVGDKIIAFRRIVESKEEEIIEPSLTPEQVYAKNNYKRIEKKPYYGKISVGSYTFGSNLPGDVATQRWRYRLSFSTSEFFTKKLVFDSYINFSYKTKDWGRVSNNISEALKVYSLNLEYKLNERVVISAGRKINRKVSNLGAYDGVDVEYNTGNNYIGAILGSRPNFGDYGYNAKLFQYGLYISRDDSLGIGPMKNSLSIFNQTNNFNTDRRFLYFQHTNYFINKLYFFLSTEIDLYQREKGVEKSSFNLTGFYTSIRYSFNPVSISLSYDARNNVIYYETYKSFADSLLDYELRQGLRGRITYRFLKYMTAGVNAGYRTRGGDIEPSKNYGGFLSHSRLPFVNISASINVNMLNTSYLDGNISAVRLSKDISFMNINLTLGYRLVNYTYKTTDYQLKQNIFTIELSSRVFNDIYALASYEGIFEDVLTYKRLYINLSYRLR